MSQYTEFYEFRQFKCMRGFGEENTNKESW